MRPGGRLDTGTEPGGLGGAAQRRPTAAMIAVTSARPMVTPRSAERTAGTIKRPRTEQLPLGRPARLGRGDPKLERRPEGDRITMPICPNCQMGFHLHEYYRGNRPSHLCPYCGTLAPIETRCHSCGRFIPKAPERNECPNPQCRCHLQLRNQRANMARGLAGFPTIEDHG